MGILDDAVERTIAVEVDRDGWLVVMPDASGDLLPESGMVSREQSRRILHAAIHEDPAPFAAPLARAGRTLIHGDPMVEFAWYLAINGTRIGAAREEVIEDNRSGYPADPDGGALALGLLGGLVQLGWNKALLATDDDPAVAALEKDDLAWWVARAREALERWSPS
jgi:hypothetical protein